MKKQKQQATSRLCFLARNFRNLDVAGYKAKADYEEILIRLGAVNLGINRTKIKNKIIEFLINLCGVILFVFRVRSTDFIVLQYPIKKYYRFLCHVAKWKGATTCTLIHDLGCFRRKKLSIEEEIRKLSLTDIVIATNETMQEWLRKQGLQVRLEHLGLHDYLSETPYRMRPIVPDTLIYAGNIAARKNAFLADTANWLDNNMHLYIYGYNDGTVSSDAKHVHLCGFITPEEFIEKAPAGFALIWDGDSAFTPTGIYGEYLHYCTHHKASLSLRAGQPLLVYEHSAIAPLVERLGIGIKVRSLADASSKLKELCRDKERCQQMQVAVQNSAEKIAQGGFLHEALERCGAPISQAFQHECELT